MVGIEIDDTEGVEAPVTLSYEVLNGQQRTVRGTLNSYTFHRV